MCFNIPSGWSQAAGQAQAKLEHERDQAHQRHQQIVNLGLTPLYRIRLCRRPVIGATQWNGSLPGHYWVEILHDDEDKDGPNGYRESYGWYPTIKSALAVPGCINGDFTSRIEKDAGKILTPRSEREAGRKNSPNDVSSRAFDPHQCDHRLGKITYVNTPYLLPGDKRTEDDIIKKIREFSVEKKYKKDYSDTWDYKFDLWIENNCHTFLFYLLYELKLAETHIGNSNDKHFNAYVRSVYLDTFFSKTADTFYKRLMFVKKNCKQLCKLLKNIK